MSYGLVDTLKKAYPVSQLCRVLDVGRHQARRLMQEAGVVAVCPKKRHRYPEGEVSRVADNHLNRVVMPANPTRNGTVLIYLTITPSRDSWLIKVMIQKPSWNTWKNKELKH